VPTATSSPTPVASATATFQPVGGFNGLVKGVDGVLPEPGQDSLLWNLWLCTDPANDGIDNDGDSTIDNEESDCDQNGEGHLAVLERVFSALDCDTRNDDDDNDGRPVDGSAADGSTSDYVGSNPREECAQPTLQDYIDDLVDKNGGEEPEGLGGLEFQLKFDHKIFDITVVPSADWTNGRAPNCSITIVTENDIRFGCVSTNPWISDGVDNDGDTDVDEGDEVLPGIPQATGQLAAVVHVLPEADLPFRIQPGKDNGVSRRLLDENCEIADIFGDIFPNTNAGLTPDCSDVDITIRRLEGDVDMDCSVDVGDSQKTAFRYGSFFGQLLFDQTYDFEPFVTGDFDVDIKDLQFVFGRLGSTCQDPHPDNQLPVPAQGVGQP
jgi:hypothetical protein